MIVDLIGVKKLEVSVAGIDERLKQLNVKLLLTNDADVREKIVTLIEEYKGIKKELLEEIEQLKRQEECNMNVQEMQQVV